MDKFLTCGEVDLLFTLLGRNFRKSDDFDLCDSTDLLDASQLLVLWSNIKACTEVLIEKLDIDDTKAIVPNSNVQTELERLKLLTNFLLQYLEGNHRRPNIFLGTLEILHDLLIPLDDELPGAKSLKSSIAKTCEYYYLNGCEGADNVLPQLIPYLLMVVNSSHSNIVKEVDIKRLYGMRSAIVLLDFSDPSIESIQELLIECFRQPVLLKSADGRKFLSFVFTIEDVLHGPIVQTMKCFLVGGVTAGATMQATSISAKDIADAYSDILLRAWKDLSTTAAANTSSFLTREGDGPLPTKPKKNKRLQEELEAEARRVECSWTGTDDRAVTILASFELSVMQVLLHDAVHASNLKYFRGLFSILQAFHNEKNSRGMDSFLIKIYNPIIWRSLKCSNAMVRAQATTLFCDVFPLRANNTSAAEDDECMQKHFNVFTLLLKDSDHRVRSSAVTGICKVLKDFWEPIPVSISNTILSYMVNTLSKDSSCANVRVAVIAGLRMLLEYCPLCHTTLRNLLPFLSNSVHDTSEKVRLEFVILLNKVKDVRDMHFYDIVPADQLLQRLVLDCNKSAICGALTGLLLANFYPQQMPTAVPVGTEVVASNINDLQLHRCLALIQQDIRSAVAFYYNLHKHASLGSTTKFAVNLLVSFNSDMDEVYETIEGVLNGGAGGRSGKDDRTKHVLIKSLVPTLQVPVGMLQVLLGIVLSVKDKLKTSLASSESNGTAELFRKYFTSSAMKNMFQLLNEAVNTLFPKENDRSAPLAPQLCAKMSVMWALYLQLVSVCVSVDPRFSVAPVAEGKRGKKKSKTSETASGISIEASVLFSSSVTLFNTAVILLDNVAYANVIQMLSLSLLDAMCSLEYEGSMLNEVIQNIKVSLENEANSANILLPGAVCLLSNLLEDQKIEFEITEDCYHQCVSKAVSKDSYFCSMLINYGFPQHLVHLRACRDALAGLGDFFPVCAEYVGKHGADEDCTDSLPAMCQCLLLWISYSLQGFHREQMSAAGDSPDYLASLAAPSGEIGNAAAALEASLQWISAVLVPLICSGNPQAPVIDLLSSILFIVSDYLVCSSISTSTGVSFSAPLLVHSNQWLTMLITKDVDVTFLHSILLRLCFLASTNDAFIEMSRNISILLSKTVVKNPQSSQAAGLAILVSQVSSRDSSAACRLLACILFTFYYWAKPVALIGVSASTTNVKSVQFLKCISALFDGSQEENDGAYQCMKSIVLEWKTNDKLLLLEVNACMPVMGEIVEKDNLISSFQRVLIDMQEEL